MNKEPYLRAILKKDKEKIILNHHPWIFSGAIHHFEEKPSEGDIVSVYAQKGEFLGNGYYHEGTIMIRILTYQNEIIDKIFFIKKIQTALDLRYTFNLIDNSETNAYRLINGEGDGIPGLIIDIYSTVAVIQYYSLGIYNLRSFIYEALQECYNAKLTTIFDKSSETLNSKSLNPKFPNSFLLGSETEIIIKENNIHFLVNFTQGQKTGFFLDQRENRNILSSFIHNSEVLNLFSYTGGFSLYALKAGAKKVVSVDSSVSAIENLQKNIELNQMDLSQHISFNEEVFEFLIKNNDLNKYDIIISDPPAFAKHLDSVNTAVRGYTRLNTTLLEKARNKSILFTFSCSQLIDNVLFRKIIFKSALQAKRTVKILHHLNQGADHPISIYHPEGDYLKGLIVYIE